MRQAIGLPRSNPSSLRLLGDGVDARRQPRFITGGGVLVEHALLYRLVEGGNGATQGRVSLFAIGGADRGAQFAQFGAQARLVQTIGSGALFRLPGALQGREMVRHILLTVLKSKFRWGQNTYSMVSGSKGQTK